MNRLNQQIVVTTYAGLEEILADEIDQMGGHNIQILRRAVRFDGTDKMIYRANYELNTAIRVLIPLYSFQINTAQELYDTAKKIDWEQWVTPDENFVINKNIFSDFFKNTNYGALLFKDAIVDQIREKTGKRPSINKDDPHISFDLQIFHNDVRISIDTSGTSLHKRGYKQATVPAPISEVLACGMLHLADFKKYDLMINPMCGSGTIAIEALRMSKNIPPQIYDDRFAFKKWKNFDEERWELILKGSKLRTRREHPKIEAFDYSHKAIGASMSNSKKAGLYKNITFFKEDFFNYTPPSGSGLVIMNPPYDKRLVSKNNEQFYYRIGQKLLKDYRGKDIWIISSDMRALKKMGIKPIKTVTLYNGSIQCSYQHYKIYDKKSST